MAGYYEPSSRSAHSPRFSRLFSTPLGSPFLTTQDPFPSSSHHVKARSTSYIRASSEPLTGSRSGGLIDGSPSRDIVDRDSRPRPGSPTPSASGYSIIGSDEAVGSAGFFTPSSRPFGTLGRRAANLSSPALNYFSSLSNNSPPPTNTEASTSLKSILPRIWDALTSPPKSSPRARSAFSPSNYRHTMYNLAASPTPQKKEKAAYKKDMYSNGDYRGHVDYIPISPLDDDEGDLIDDEACFVAVDFWGVGIEESRARVVSGIDILSILPTELSLYVLSMLGPSCPSATQPANVDTEDDPLRALIACLSVSKYWRRLASDNGVWRSLFLWRWGSINDTRAEEYLLRQARQLRRRQGLQTRRTISVGREAMLRSSPWEKVSSLVEPSSPILKWDKLFRERHELERRWRGTALIPRPAFVQAISESSSLPHVARHPELHSELHVDSQTSTEWQPRVTRLSGHSDSVYCLEFTDQYVFTGSRDRSIKVWSQKSGRCLGTFGRKDGNDDLGGHKGSVLCLRFLWENMNASETDGNDGYDGLSRRMSLRNGKTVQRGILFSGSSDCTIYVWDLYICSKAPKRRPSGWGPGREWRTSQFETMKNELDTEDDECEVVAKAKAVLKGHGGGVLDLRVDDNWIVSCSKDTVIRVWNRKTLELYRTLKGHEGPVNAVGLETGKIVSASGDGKMILWDIECGQRLRTLDGHDRGLACIGFKDGIIVSGSNDSKIKIWSSETGECIRTLVGHNALVRTLAFDPRTGRLVSGSYDKSIRVWDLWSGRLLREFKNHHTSHIFDVKFDACRIVSTSHDQKVAILDFSGGIDSSGLFI